MTPARCAPLLGTVHFGTTILPAFLPTLLPSCTLGPRRGRRVLAWRVRVVFLFLSFRLGRRTSTHLVGAPEAMSPWVSPFLPFSLSPSLTLSLALSVLLRGLRGAAPPPPPDEACPACPQSRWRLRLKTSMRAEFPLPSTLLQPVTFRALDVLRCSAA